MARKPGIELQSIIETARDIVDEEGIHALTLATVAKRLKIRPPSLYNHIGGLTDLQRTLAVYGLKELYSSLSQALADQADDEAIHTFSLTYIRFVRTNPGLYEATLWAGDGLVSPEAEEVATRILDLVSQLFHFYHIKGEAAIHAARGLRSMLHGFASLEQHNGFGLPIDLDVSITRTVDAFISGIHTMED